MLLKTNININHQNSYGNTGFIKACANNYIKIVKMLLKKNVNKK